MRPNFLPFPLRHILLLILLLGSAFQGVSQNPETNRANHWFTGFNSGLDFSGGTPVADTNGLQRGFEACVSMSDTNGDLLFYGASDTLYTRNHQFMSNGDLDNSAHPSQMLAVPKPGSDSLFYVFYSNAGGSNKAQYAVVDMSLNGGNGAVILKDQVLLNGTSNDKTSEKVAAIKHCNGEDIWVLLKKRDSKDLMVWELTSSGISSTPVTTPSIGQDSRGSGAFQFSPNGEFAAAAYDGKDNGNICKDTIELYRFDDCTGQFSNPIEIPFRGALHTSFSPNNEKLYAGRRDEGSCVDQNNPAIVVQYDLVPYQRDSILASRTILFSSPDWSFLDLQIGPDGRIYVMDNDFNSATHSSHHLGVITNPNAEGGNVNFLRDTVYCGGSLGHGLSFPGFDESYFDGLTPVSIKQNDQEPIRKRPSVLPTATEDHLTIRSPRDENLKAVQVMDMAGRIIDEWKGREPRVRIGLGSQKNGMYILRIQLLNDKMYNQKVLKL